MKRLVTSLGLTILGSVQLAGCVDDTPQDCLPGDIDCATADGNGKEDGFDYWNDPLRMSKMLTYTLADLPKTGKLTTPTWKDKYPDAVGKAAVAWTDTYWPTTKGSHNVRWQGSSIQSPMEKYDEAFNNTAGCVTQPPVCGPGSHAAWDTYYACAGPAAKWQSQKFEDGGWMHDGIDNNSDGMNDECGGTKGYDGVETWMGTCHAWTPASLTVPEPQHSVTVNGVTFEVGDIKALIQNSFDYTSSVMLGGRCNSQTITHDVNGSANDACSDVNPGAFHVVLTNFLGLAQLPLIEDRTASSQVWNQPIVGYNVTKQMPIKADVANACVGQAGDTWKYNANAVELYEVAVTVQYIYEGDASTMPLGFEHNIATDKYHYVLELGSTGKVIGGRFCTDSTNNHVDFLWSPTGDHHPTNPNVKLARVNELISKAVSSDPNGGGGGGSTAKVFTATPNAPIPDNSLAGISIDIPVTGVTAPADLAVSVDITHTYRQDLSIDLYRDGILVTNLTGNSGGSVDNIVETYNLRADQIGSSLNGTWSVKVIDNSLNDTGTVNTVTLSFE